MTFQEITFGNHTIRDEFIADLAGILNDYNWDRESYFEDQQPTSFFSGPTGISDVQKIVLKHFRFEITESVAVYIIARIPEIFEEIPQLIIEQTFCGED